MFEREEEEEEETSVNTTESNTIHNRTLSIAFEQPNEYRDN